MVLQVQLKNEISSAAAKIMRRAMSLRIRLVMHMDLLDAFPQAESFPGFRLHPAQHLASPHSITVLTLAKGLPLVSGQHEIGGALSVLMGQGCTTESFGMQLGRTASAITQQ